MVGSEEGSGEHGVPRGLCRGRGYRDGLRGDKLLLLPRAAGLQLLDWGRISWLECGGLLGIRARSAKRFGLGGDSPHLGGLRKSW